MMDNLEVYGRHGWTRMWRRSAAEQAMKQGYPDKQMRPGKANGTKPVVTKGEPPKKGS